MKIDLTSNSPVEFKNQVRQILRQCNHAVSSLSDKFEQQSDLNDLKLENNHIEPDNYKNNVLFLAKSILQAKIKRLNETLDQLKEIDSLN